MNRRDAIIRGARRRGAGATKDPKEPKGGEPLEPAEQAELKEIDEALKRIEHGSYGHCERCGNAIGRQRLRAAPEVRHCLSCSET